MLKKTEKKQGRKLKSSKPAALIIGGTLLCC